jgi:hypothetical protein
MLLKDHIGSFLSGMIPKFTIVPNVVELFSFPVPVKQGDVVGRGECHKLIMENW